MKLLRLRIPSAAASNPTTLPWPRGIVSGLFFAMFPSIFQTTILVNETPQEVRIVVESPSAVALQIKEGDAEPDPHYLLSEAAESLRAFAFLLEAAVKETAPKSDDGQLELPLHEAEVADAAAEEPSDRG
jgi:hypothetical protein